MKDSRPNLILFDVDGTLIKIFGAGRQALASAFQTIFGRDDVASQLDSTWFAGKTDRFIFHQLAVRTGVSREEYQRRYPELEAEYLERLEAAVMTHPQREILPGVESLLSALEAKPGVALGLMTGNLEAGARVKLAPWDLNRFFPSGGFGSDALDRREIGRIARERYERLLAKALPPQSVLLVGDTLADIEAARSCGFRILAVASGWTSAEVLDAASPDHIAQDLADTEGLIAAIGL